MLRHSKERRGEIPGVSILRSVIGSPRISIRGRLIILMIGLVSVLQIAPAIAQNCNDKILSSTDPLIGESFGKAMAVHGRTLVVGAPGSVDGRSKYPGRAFVFEFDDDKWHLVAELSSSESENGDEFGTSVAVEDDVVVIGAVRARGLNDKRTGAAYVFHRPKSGWRTTSKPDQTLNPSRGAARERFGTAVELSDDRILVGMPLFGDAPRDHGAVFVYARDGDEWVERQILTRPEPVRNEHFGMRIDMEGDLAVIGAPNIYWHALPGTAHVFLRAEGDDAWTHVQTLSAGNERTAGDHFGRSIALQRGPDPEDHWLVVGATGDDDHGEHSGSAHIFHVEDRGSGYAWKRVGKIVAGGGEVGDHFGFSVDIVGPFIIAGAHSTNSDEFKNVGATSLFVYSWFFQRWIELARLFPDCAAVGDRYGMTCTFFIDPDSGRSQIIVGAPGAEPDDVRDAGAIHIID